MIHPIIYDIALNLYQEDWKKIYNDIVVPDMYMFKYKINVKESMPYIVRANEVLKVRIRTLKLQKIKNQMGR